MSRLSQELLKNPKPYRHQIRLKGKKRYILLEPKEWNQDRDAVHALF